MNINLLKKQKVQQVSALFTSSFLTIPVSLLLSILNTRFLGKESFGDMKFIQNLLTLLISFTSFGVFNTAAKMIASEKDETIKKQIIGVSNVCALVFSFIISMLLIVYSFFHNNIYGNELGSVIRIFAPFYIILFFLNSTEKIFIGDNQIKSLAAFRIVPKLINVGLVFFFFYIYTYNLHTALTAFYLSMFFVLLLRLKYLQPSFKNFRYSLNRIFAENKNVGFPMYVGAIFGVGAGHLAGLVIGYYSDNIDVGYYSLAMVIAAPVAFIPRAVGESYFKEFASRRNIPRKLIIMTIGISAVSLIIFNILLKPVVILFYTEEFLSSVHLARFSAWAMIFYGFGDLFNRFLASNGNGHYIRNGAIASGITAIIGFFVFIPIFGTIGAVLTKLFAALIYVVFMFYYYRKSLKYNDL